MPFTARGRAVTADGVTSALAEDSERLASVIVGARTRTLGAASLFVSGIPIALLNGVMTVRTSASAADIAELLQEIEDMAIPHSVQIRPGCASEVTELVKSRGMVEDEAVPLMAMERDFDSVGRAAHRPDLSIRMLDAGEASLHHTIAAEGFEEPIDIFQRFMPPAMMAVPGFRAYVGSVDGTPVTTALGSTIGEYVGIFDVATPARHRRHGYGAAITARAMLDGFKDGASYAYLQSSAMGLRVYEGLGFRTLEMWSVWVSGPSRS